MVTELVEEMTQVEMKRRRFTVAELLHLAKIGFLGNDERVELIRGEIVEMSPLNVAHVLCVNRLTALLVTRLVGQAMVSIQNPIQLDDFSLPQPDIAIWKLPSDEFRGRLPGPSEVLLVIEVADTSVSRDRRVKARLYAEAGIVEYWLVNLPERRVEVYREPLPDGYRATVRFRLGEALSPLAFPDMVVSVDDILGANA
jgi:Uma2 family endonuclease